MVTQVAYRRLSGQFYGEWRGFPGISRIDGPEGEMGTQIRTDQNG